MATEYLTNDTDLKTVADAIRAKGGTSAALTFPDGFAEAVQNIVTVDLSGDTVTADKLLAGATAHNSANEPITGTMPNNGAVAKTLTASETSYTIPKGYHSGSGKVNIVTQTKSVTPTTSAQTVYPDTGKLLSAVAVAAAAAGKQVYTGLVSDSTGTVTKSINTGIAHQAGDTFYLFPEYTSSVAIDGQVIMAASGSNVYYANMGSYDITYDVKVNGVTYSGTNVTIQINWSMEWYAGYTMRWVIIR